MTTARRLDIAAVLLTSLIFALTLLPELPGLVAGLVLLAG